MTSSQAVIQVKLYGSLAARLGGSREVALTPPCTVLSLLGALGLDGKDVSVSVVNGVQVPLAAGLENNDIVMLVPPVIGG